MKTNNLFFGGVPTGPDVEKIRESYPDYQLQPGQIVPYGEIENIIMEKRGASRFKTVTVAWRNDVQLKTGHVIDPDVSAGGFRVLTEEEKLEKAMKHRGKAKKQIIKGAKVLNITDRNALPDVKRVAFDHEMKNVGIATAALQIRARVKLPTLEEK